MLRTPFWDVQPTWRDSLLEQCDQDWFSYVFAPGALNPNNGVSATLAPNQSAIAQVNIQQDSAFQVEQFSVNASNNANDTSFGPSANLSIQITDTAAGRNLFNEAIPVGLIAGDGAFPYILPVPRRFMPRGSIIITMTNYDTAITYKNIQFVMHGRKIFLDSPSRPISRFRSWRDPISGRILSEDFFAYHFQFGNSIAASDLQSVQIIEADSDFEARTMSASQNAALNTGSNTAVNGENFISLKDGGSQRNLSNTPIIGQAYTGYKGTPYILPVPRIFLARTQVITNMHNNSAATTIPQTDLVLAGRKIFEYGRE